MKSVVCMNSFTGELHRLDVDSRLPVRELKSLLLLEIPSLRGAAATIASSELQLWTEQGQCLLEEDTLAGEGANEIEKEEEVEEMRLQVKVHRRLPVVCRGCSRHYEVTKDGGAPPRDSFIDRRAGKDDNDEKGVKGKKGAVTASPCLLQCGHSICLDCMKSWFQTVASSSVEGETSASSIREPWKLMCPEPDCGRRGVSTASLSISTDECGTNADSLYCQVVVPHMAMEEYLRWKRRRVDMESALLCWNDVSYSEATVLSESIDEITKTVDGASGGNDREELKSKLESLKERLESADKLWMDMQEEIGRITQANHDRLDQLSNSLEKLFDAMEQRLKKLRESTRLDLRNRHMSVEKSLQESCLTVSKELGRLKTALMECDDLLTSRLTEEADAMSLVDAKEDTNLFLKQKAEIRRLSTPIDASEVFEKTMNGLRKCLAIPMGIEFVSSTARSIRLRIKWSPFAKSPSFPRNAVLTYREDSGEEFMRSDKLEVDFAGTVTLQNLNPNTVYIVRSCLNPSVTVVSRTAGFLTREEFIKATPSGDAFRETLVHYQELFHDRIPTPEDNAILMIIAQYFSRIKDYANSRLFYSLSADTGHMPAKFELAMYSGDPSVPLRELAEHGCVEALNQLGMLYTTGTGVQIDNVEAAKWFRRSAEQGDSNGQYNLGWSLDEGKGVPQNKAEAMTWYEKAAKQGDGDAMIRLGRLYEKGTAVEQDYAKAEEFYVAAARVGHKDAKLILQDLMKSRNPNVR